MRSGVLFVILTVALATVGIGLSLRKPDTTRPVLITSPFAPGQFLAASAIEWTTLWGQHSMTLDLSTTQESVTFSFPEAAMISICNDILQAMPHAPDGVQRDKVYRINIRKVGTRDVNLPLKVAEGQCADWKAGTILFPNYPPPLQDWQLTSYETVRDNGGGMRFVFAAVPGSDGQIAETTFADACYAALTEPVLIDRKLLQNLEGKIASIRLARDRGFVGLRVGTWKEADFRVLSGACAPVDEGQKT